MLSTAYKIFGKILSMRLAHRLKKWICVEQKGFVQGRYILDAIIIIWEGVEYAAESEQDFLFVKVDVDKAYEIGWHGPSFYNPWRARVVVPSLGYLLRLSGRKLELECVCEWPTLYLFAVSKSTRRGCPLAPLLFAIAADNLCWLVKGRCERASSRESGSLMTKDTPTFSCLQMTQVHFLQMMGTTFITSGTV